MTPEELISYVLHGGGEQTETPGVIKVTNKELETMGSADANNYVSYVEVHNDTAYESAKRGNVLLEAHKIINGERQDQYGKPENNFAYIAKLWTTYLDIPYTFTAHDVAMMMGLMKIARIKTGVGTKDSYVDASAYTALAFDISGK